MGLPNCTKNITALNVIVVIFAICFMCMGGILEWNKGFLVSQGVSKFTEDAKTNEYMRLGLEDSFMYTDGAGLGLFILGVILFLVALVGIAGAALKSRILLMVNALFLVLVLISLIAYICVIATKKEEVKTNLGRDLSRKAQNEYGSKSKITNMYDAMQRDLKCCGGHSRRDYVQNKYLRGDLPSSCCKNYQTCTGNPTEANSYIKQQCLYAFWEYLGVVFDEFVYTLVAFIVIYGIVTILIAAASVVHFKSHVDMSN